MTSLRRALIGLAFARLRLRRRLGRADPDQRPHSPRGLAAALILVAGWGFAGTGLYAWDRRPGNNVGPLMTAIGFTWFFQALGSSNNSVVFTIGVLGGSRSPTRSSSTCWSPSPPAGWRTRIQTCVVGVAYFITTVMQVAWALFADPSAGRLRGLPGKPDPDPRPRGRRRRDQHARRA